MKSIAILVAAALVGVAYGQDPSYDAAPTNTSTPPSAAATTGAAPTYGAPLPTDTPPLALDLLPPFLGLPQFSGPLPIDFPPIFSPVSHSGVTTVYEGSDECSTSYTSTTTDTVTIDECPECEDRSTSANPFVLTTYTTVYSALCPTGLEDKTYVVTETCEKPGASLPAGYIPSGFTVTTVPCPVCTGSSSAVLTTPCDTSVAPTPPATAAPGPPGAAYPPAAAGPPPARIAPYGSSNNTAESPCDSCEATSSIIPTGPGINYSSLATSASALSTGLVIVIGSVAAFIYAC